MGVAGHLGGSLVFGPGYLALADAFRSDEPGVQTPDRVPAHFDASGVGFEHDVTQILAEHCYGCHSHDEKIKGG